jgi:hypothetical protein
MTPIRCIISSVLVLLGSAGAAQAADQGPIRIRVEPFISLPANVRHPEGLGSKNLARFRLPGAMR